MVTKKEEEVSHPLEEIVIQEDEIVDDEYADNEAK
jgi:hypothetical protein